MTRVAGASGPGILNALNRFGIPKNEDRPTRIGPLPFVFDYLNHKLVKNGAEQAAFRMMRQYRACGLSLQETAGNLNLKLIPTKQNGIWQANTLREILARVGALRHKRAKEEPRKTAGSDPLNTYPCVGCPWIIEEDR